MKDKKRFFSHSFSTGKFFLGGLNSAWRRVCLLSRHPTVSSLSFLLLWAFCATPTLRVLSPPSAMHDLPWLTLLKHSFLFSLIACGVLLVFRQAGRMVLLSTDRLFHLAASSLATVALFVPYVLLARAGHLFTFKTLALLIFVLQGGWLGVALLTTLFAHHRKAKRVRSRRPFALILGNAEGTEALLKHLLANPFPAYSILGVLAPNASLMQRYLYGSPVLGCPEDLPAIFDKLGRTGPLPELILVTDVTLSAKEVSKLVADAQELKIRLLHLPRTQTAGHLCHPKTAPLSLVELLSHKLSTIDWEGLGETFHGSTVLAIGAGRGVGKACLSKFAKAACHKLVYTDTDPEALEEASQMLDTSFPHLFHEPILLDTRRKESVVQTIQTHKPDFVLHTSEILSTGVVRRQPLEGLWTNVLGVRYVTDAALAIGCRGLVFVSHESADQPKDLLWATKRLGEVYVQAQDVKNAPLNKTAFSVVRLKPLLNGKRGLLTRFNEAIQSGGPIVIPHPDMMRTYTTLSESAAALLQAFRLRHKTMLPAGSVFVQDASEPLSLYEMAQTLVRLYGLTPGKDIDIQWTGLAKGGRVVEHTDRADMRRQTGDEHLFVTSPGRSFSEEHNQALKRDLDKLEIATLKGDEKTALALLEKLVPHQEGKTSGYQASA